MSKNWDTLRQVCNSLLNGDKDTARAWVARLELPEAKQLDTKKGTLGEFAKTKVFVRDGFIDRYSGDRLVFPPVFPLIGHYLPEVFPYHSNWAFDRCHPCIWNLSATVDHYISRSLGGTDEMDNLYTTSMRRNQMKYKHAFEDLQWDIVPPGDGTWDGLARSFVVAIDRDPPLLGLPRFKKWYTAATRLVLAA